MTPRDLKEQNARLWRWGMNGKTKHPVWGQKRGYCFALDYGTKEPIILNTWCEMEICTECVPTWWMAL